MELLPEEVRQSLPALYSCEGQKDPTVHVKFFSPFSPSWTWYVIEGSQEQDDFVFFGFVVGLKANGDTSPSHSSKK